MSGEQYSELAAFLYEAQLELQKHYNDKCKLYEFDFVEDKPLNTGRFNWLSEQARECEKTEALTISCVSEVS